MKEFVKKYKTVILVVVLMIVGLVSNEVMALPIEMQLGIMAAVSAYPSNPEMTNICAAYSNELYVADDFCPYTASVQKMGFKHDSYPVGEQLTPQDDRVSRKGEIAEIDYSSEQITNTIEDHALSSYVPYADYTSAKDPDRVLNNAAMQTMNKLKMNREIRVANLAFNINNYSPSNVLVITTAADRFTDDSTNAMAVINLRLDTMIMRANTMTLNQAAWLALRSNPFIVAATQHNEGKTGMATLQAVADLFELSNIIVARANRNVNNNPKSLNAGKIWGNHLSLTYLEPAAQTEGTFTYCATVPFESERGITAGEDFDKKRGVRGSVEVRVAQQIKEIIIAKEAGALITGVA